MARRAPGVLAPSDLGAARPGRVRIGGRVAQATAGELIVHDARESVRVRGEGLTASPGDLVVVEGKLFRRAISDARLLERHRHPAPRGDGDVARFAWSGTGSLLAARAQALSTIRDYFREQGFLEVETPIRVTAPGVDAHVDALRAEGGYLVTSPELHLKRLLVGGLPRVFELARVLRADESGTLHEPEFTLLEWYRAFAGEAAIRRDTEQIIARVATSVRRRSELLLPGGRKLSCRPPFPVVSVRDAFRRWAGVRDAADLAASDEGRFFELLVERVEPALARIDRPVFLVEYPLALGALARPTPADPTIVERFELYAGGIELSNGYGELTDPVEQRRRFELERARRRHEGRRVYPVDRRFLAALREGMPPSAGNALGLDRLVMLATGAATVAQVRAFPWKK